MVNVRARLSPHGPFAGLLLIGVVLRVMVTLAYQPALMLQRDTYIYLQTASGGAAPGFRPALYSIFLKPAVWLGNLTVVPVFQHLLGLGLGTLTYLLLRRLGAGPWLGALGAAPVLLDAYQLDLEQYVLTETVFQALAVGAVLLLAWRARPALWAVALAGVLCALAGATRFVGVVLIVPAVIYVIWARLGWLRLGALVAGFALTFGIYSVWSTSGSEGGGISAKNGFFLYGRVASFADCDRVKVPLELRRLCISVPPEQRGPNYGFFTLDLPIEVLDDRRANAQLLDFSRRMILGQPWAYVRVILADLWRFAEPSSPPSKEPYVKRWMFVSSVREADPLPFVKRFGGSPRPRSGIEQTFRIEEGLAKPLFTYQRFAYLWGPLLGLSVLLGLLGAVLGPSPREGRSMRAACGLVSLSALALLLVPVMTTVYHFRYVIGPLPLVGPAGVLGFNALRMRFAPRRQEKDEDLERVQRNRV